jgi:hypothetical protein
VPESFEGDCVTLSFWIYAAVCWLLAKLNHSTHTTLVCFVFVLQINIQTSSLSLDLIETLQYTEAE